MSKEIPNKIFNIFTKNIIWISPFIAFILGYQLLNFLQKNNKIYAPNITGLSLHQASKELTKYNLNLRVLTEKLDPDLPAQTIISQKPYAGQNIKPQQTVFLVLSKQPDPILMPDFINKDLNKIDKLIKKLNLKPTFYYQNSNLPKNFCIAQIPDFNSPILDKNNVTIYLSYGDNKNIIMPDFRNLDLLEAKEFLDLHKIKYNIINLNPNSKNSFNKNKLSIIQEQRPLAGSILNLDELKLVTLKIN